MLHARLVVRETGKQCMADMSDAVAAGLCQHDVPGIPGELAGDHPSMFDCLVGCMGCVAPPKEREGLAKRHNLLQHRQSLTTTTSSGIASVCPAMITQGWKVRWTRCKGRVNGEWVEARQTHETHAYAKRHVTLHNAAALRKYHHKVGSGASRVKYTRPGRRSASLPRSGPLFHTGRVRQKPVALLPSVWQHSREAGLVFTRLPLMRVARWGVLRGVALRCGSHARPLGGGGCGWSGVDRGGWEVRGED